MNWHRFHTTASIAMLRTLLICINTVFLITGAILFLLGIVLRSQIPNVDQVVPEMHSSAPYIILGLGLFIFFTGLFAFWCTINGHVALLYTYSCLLLLIFLSEILLAVTVFMKKRTLEQSFKTSVRRIMEQYPRKPMNAHIDQLQTTLACCGVDSYADWLETPYGSQLSRVPDSCCKKSLDHSCERMNLNNQSSTLDINTNGCYTTVIATLKTHSPIMGGLLLVVALVPLLGSILSCALIRQMGKHRYEPVN